MDQVVQMEWRVLARYPTHEISEYGDVRRIRDSATRRAGYRAKCYVNLDGYLAVSLPNEKGATDCCLIHRLVAETFIGPPPTKEHEAAHNNGSRLGNYWKNLRWALRKENAEDQQIHETALKGMANGRATITDEDVRYIRAEYALIKVPASGRKVTELEDKFGLHRATIVGIAMRRTWKHVT